ncbi:copper resistance CopC/CopD family protein [Streptomyces antibioticus]|uniref:Protein YobA n=1 Tax=Streptomyces antibioticus TaxID=1890 RepID=A0AAE7CPL1_STRAT|nr:copper resistance protein CopC [Streptomyces antibioticus]OOQ50002.1 transporter [Streptomyces antibioticus]QIT48965.1 copper resistance protein CopC/CopD [Streptomyces antibioticus]
MLLGSVLVLLLLGGGPASAHAALRGTDPADGSVVKTSPRAITLTFTESVGLLDDSFRVLDPDNQRVRTGKAGHAEGRADTVSVALPEKLGTGTFTVAWRVVSEDSHPVSGAFTFSVGEPSATRAVLPSGADDNPVTDGLYNIGRDLAYIGAALLIGAAAFVALCRPPDRRPLRALLLGGGWALAGSTVFLFFLRGPYEAGTGPAGMFDPSGLTRTLSSRPGLALLARLVLLAAAAVLLLRQSRRETPSRAGLATGAVLAVGLALTWAGAEHASAGIQVPAAMTSSVLHLLAMAVWMGGLPALLLLLHRASVPSTVVIRFSRLAGASVAVLVLTGVYQSWRGLGSWSALTDTTYGRLLLAKLAAVAVLLAAGALSRRTVRRGTAVPTTTTASVAEAGEESRVPEPAGAVAVAAGVSGAAASSASSASAVSARASVSAGASGASETSAPGADPASASASASGEGGSAASEGGSALAEDGSSPGEGGPDPAEGGGSAPAASTPRRPLAPAEDTRRRALRRSVLFEVAVSVVVLLLTTILTGTLPGRAAAEAAAAEQTAGLPVASVTIIPFDAGLGMRGKVQVTLDPGRVGDNNVQAVVYGPDGGFVSIPELRLSFTLPSQDIGPLDAKLTDRGGYWASDGLNLPIPGTWEMKATVRVTDTDQVSETKPVEIVR